MTTRLAEVRKGIWDQFDRRLNGAGLTAEMVEAVAADGGEAHAAAMVDVLRVRLEPPTPVVTIPQIPAFTRADLFIQDPAEIIRRVRERNLVRNWGFTDGDFTALKDPPKVADGPEHNLTALVLVPYLPDETAPKTGKKKRRRLFSGTSKPMGSVQRTFEEHVLWIKEAHNGAFWRWDQLLSDPEHLRILGGNERHVPGLRWEVINLGDNWDKVNGTVPETVRNPDTSPSAGVLVSAAIHKGWAQRMDGVNVPHAWCPGYEATIPGHGSWQGVPYVDRDGGRRVRVFADGCGNRGRRWAVPSLVKGE